MLKKLTALLLMAAVTVQFAVFAENTDNADNTEVNNVFELDLSAYENDAKEIENVRVDSGLDMAVKTMDDEKVLEVTAPTTGLYLYITVPFKKDTEYCISYKIRTASGSGSIRTSVTRQESFPNMELLTYTKTIGEEWMPVEHSYKCFLDYDLGTDDVTGDVSIPFNTANTYYITDFKVYEKDYNKIAYEFPYKPFTDMDDHWAKPLVTKMAFLGVVNGFEDGTYKPEDTVTRAEFITMVMNYTKDDVSDYKGAFSDVNATQWYANYAQTAADKGYIPNAMISDGKFYPQQNITREEMAAITSCIYKTKAEDTYKADLSVYTDSGAISQWAYEDMEIAARLGIVNGVDETTIQPQGNATRAQAAVMLSRLSQAIDNIALKDTFINFCNRLADACEADGQGSFASALREDLEYFKENTLVERSDFREGLVTEVDSFYENPYVRMLFNTDESFSNGFTGENAYPLHVSNKTIKNWINRYILPASHANTASAILFMLGTPESPYSGNTAALDNLLTMIESLSNAAADDGEISGFYDSTDDNYNMFFYDPYCVMYYTFVNTYPCFNLPSLSDRYTAFIERGIEFLKNNYGKGGYYEHYQNVDLIYLNSLMAAGMTLGRQDWIDEANHLIEVSYERMFEDGGTPYIYNETEIPSYHNAVLRDFMRIYTVCHNETIERIMKKTEGYYRTMIEPSGVSTAGSSILIWKRSNATGTNTSMAPVITYHFTKDDYNKKMAQLQLLRIPSLDFGEGALVAMAFCWSPELSELGGIDELTFEDNYIDTNSNINGFSGRFGNFSFVGDGMSRIVTEAPANVPSPFKVGKSAGKTSFVGATISNAESIASKTSIDSTLHMAYSAVRISSGNNPKDFANTAGVTHDSTIVTDDFATLSTVYELGTFTGLNGWEYWKRDGWLGKQAWYTEEDRLIGYIGLESQDTNNVSDMMAKLMFDEGGHVIEKIDETHYKYGKFRVHVIKTNYDTTTIDDNAWRITAESHKSNYKAHELIFGSNSTDKIYKGESRYLLVEIYPEWLEDSKSIEFSRLPEGVIKLDIKTKEDSEKVSLLYNETDKEVTLSLKDVEQIYTVPETLEKVQPQEYNKNATIAPYQHIVVK